MLHGTIDVVFLFVSPESLLVPVQTREKVRTLTITLTHTTNLHPNLIRVYAFESPRYTYYHFTTPLSLAKHVAFRIMYRSLL